MVDCALLFPPLWYFSAVPGDMAVAAGALKAAGLGVLALDLNQRFFEDLLHDVPAWHALKEVETFEDPERLRESWFGVDRTLRQIGKGFGATLSMAELSLPHLEPASVRSALKSALVGTRNPAVPTLHAAAAEVVQSGARVAAIAVVHPDQRPQAVALAALLREKGFAGKVVIFGGLEDPLSPMDFADDLVGAERRHGLFFLVDHVLLGEVETTLPALVQGQILPGVVGPSGGERAAAVSLAEAPLPDWSWVQGPARAPHILIDLRLGRGCSWGRCTFCAIPAQQPGYRSGGPERLRASLLRAHAQTGSTWFRLRDDLLTPPQIRQVAAVFRSLPFRAHWTARARVSAQLTEGVLLDARSSGLDELWIGLESGSERLRASMDKGARVADVDSVMAAASAAGVGIRALLMVGYPGESEADFQQTHDWVESHLEQLAGIAVTPFHPMRQSPVGARPTAFGLTPMLDEVRASDRLRHDLPVRDPLQGQVEGRMRRLRSLVTPHVLGLPAADPVTLWVHRGMMAAPHSSG